MIRIRPIYAADLPADRWRIEQAEEIFRAAFPREPDKATLLEELLNDPPDGARTVLLVSENAAGRINAFALLLHWPGLKASFLDYMAVRPGIRGGGLGGAIYEAARDHCLQIGSKGLFMEVWPDDPQHWPDPADLKEHRRRLRFYEGYDAYPVVGTEYETGTANPPAPPAMLVFDALGSDRPLRAAFARRAVRAILQARYGEVAPDGYIDHVIKSFRDDPVALRPPRYHRQPAWPKRHGRLMRNFAAVYDQTHVIHHIHSRGYVERPARVAALRKAIEATGLFDILKPAPAPLDAIRAVHDPEMVAYLQRMSRQLKDRPTVYPDVFPVRRLARPPRELINRAGYWCLDSFTPLTGTVFPAARAAVGVALTAAREVRTGRRVAYALCRPPGHHAERSAFGGFCYFNNAAIAAHSLARHGPVAVLDIDAHHGNGTQDIFYDRRDVLTISLHGHPDFEYPYFHGFAEETGRDDGEGGNLNLPLAKGTGPEGYLKAFGRAMKRIDAFRPDFLVVSLGLDTLRGDPTGQFRLDATTLRTLGRQLAERRRPVLVVQEGGYNLRNLKSGVRAFFNGLAEGLLGR